MKSSVVSPTVRLGLVGCGRLAELGYLPALRRISGIKLAAVADVNRLRCQQIAPTVPSHANIHALLETGVIDAIAILTPTRFHLSDARAVAEAGLPSILEKPPGLNLEEADALRNLKPSPFLGLNRRFDPAIAQLKSMLPDGGKIHLKLSYRRRSWKPFDMEDDALLDLSPHLIDLARWLTGDQILSARAFFLNDRDARFRLTLERWIAMIDCSMDSRYCEFITIADTRGRLHAAHRRGGVIDALVHLLSPPRESPLVLPLIGQLEAFECAVRGDLNASPLATSEDGLVVMRVIEAVRRSAKSNGAECAL